MKFEEKHAQFIRSHLERRLGERRGRLERGHQHGEKLFLRNVCGHFTIISMIFIRNMRSWIGEGDPTLLTLPICQET